MSTNRLDPGFSLFNYHVNDAKDKARELFIRVFGEQAWEDEIQPYEESGIMAITSKPPTFYTAFYITAVTLIVNGDVTVNEEGHQE